VGARHAGENAKEGICFNPQNAGSSAERDAVKLATSEAAHPGASRSHEQIIISSAIKISQIWANHATTNRSELTRLRQTEKKFPIFGPTLLRPVISDTLTSFMVAGLWCNARAVGW
jgi:hypothetical protein